MGKTENKIAVVTGGESGIGKAVAEILAKNGAVVYILDVQNNNVQPAHFIECDVSNQQQCLAAIEQIISKEGRIDILINNAGISHIGTVETTSEEDFDRVYRINVKGLYNCTLGCIPVMKKSGGGVIINLASVASSVGLPQRFAYSMSKGAVMSMTYSIAKDYIDDNIRCNAVAPGRVRTAFVDGYIKKHYPGQEKEMFEKLSKSQPIGRMGEPEEIAGLVLYLCSDEASFITGSIIPIDGGSLTLNTK